jgi:ribulose-phosphate 3-epimerase
MTQQDIILAPSILDADFAHLGDAVRAIEAGGADWIHLDVMDGHFVPNISFGPPIVRAVRSVTQLPLDVHLMIENAERYIDAFAKAGATSISVHPETGYHLHRTLDLIRSHGVSPGVALNPATPLSAVEEVLDAVDLVLIMSVNPGFGGQKFIHNSLDKIQRLRNMAQARRRPLTIQVDGGIEPTRTATQVVRAGATNLVVGSAIFKSPDGPAAALAALRQATRRAKLVEA